MKYNLLNIICSPTFLFSLSFVILIISLFRKNNNFFDIRGIFLRHFKIFSNAKLWIFIFFGIPFLLSIAILQIKLIDKDIINNINIVLSIFISMFFAILGIIVSFQKKKSAVDPFNILLEETFSTILFEIIVCIFILILSFIHLFLNNFTPSASLTFNSFIIYYLLLVVLLNILILLKRIHTLYLFKDN